MQKSQYILCKIIIVGLKCRHNCFILNISFYDVSLLANPFHFCGLKTWWNLLIGNEFPFALQSLAHWRKFWKIKVFFFRGKFGKEEHFVGEWQEECQLFWWAFITHMVCGTIRHVCGHRFSEIPVHLECSQLLEVRYP